MGTEIVATPIQRSVAIEVLTKRQRWLGSRMAQAEAAGRVLIHDRLEFAALQLALDALQKEQP